MLIMKTKTDVQLELLQELHEICLKNKLKYILYGTNALNGYLNNTLKDASKYMSVAMTNGDIERFCSIIEKDYSKDRYVEGVFNNPFFIPFYVTYGNRNTTDFYVANSNRNKHHGINIRLYPICKFADLDRNELTVWDSDLSEEREYRESFTDPTEKGDFWKMNVESRIYSHSKRGNEYYEQYKQYNAIDKWKDIQKYSIIRIDKKTFFSKLLKATVEIEVDGIKVCLPKATDAFFKRLYGENFRNRRIRMQAPGKREIIDTEVGYKKIIRQNNRLLKEAISLDDEIKIANLNVEDEKETVNNVWRLVQMTDRQVKFKHHFDDDVIENLLKKDLDDKDQFNEVYAELRPVISILNRYADYGLTFSVNPKVDGLIEEVLLKRDNKELLDEIRNLSQKEYLIE